MLKALKQSGADVIYSSELVPPDVVAPPARAGDTPLDRARAALAANGLALRTLGPNTYVVVRAAPPAPVPVSDEPMDEVSVYASRYAIDGGLAEPRKMSPTDIERVPGSHDDSLRALHSLPGIASNASARPYIRGSLSEDVLVRYDGIPLLDPFHLKNFQSLISAIDPAGIEHIEVFSGGFPVQYGTRSGGVIDVTAPSYAQGHEFRASASLISAGVSSIGKAQELPIEWLGSIRHSVLDTIDQVEDGFGKPKFSDTLGRVRYLTGKGAWTVGWLLLDDRLELGSAADEEEASARYRDEYVWLARDHQFNDSLRTRASLVVTSAERGREGTLRNPGVATGTLDERRSFNGFDFANDWTFKRSDASRYTFGLTLGATRADYRYSRHSEFSPEVAAAFSRGLTEDLEYAVRPEIVTYAVYGANRRRWKHFEAEVGIRLDAQHYEAPGDGNHTQVSPRLNLRYDFADEWRLYGSIGRFTQAQHVEEWRVEEAQQRPDSAQVSIHSIIGLEYDTAGELQLGLEAYSKRWTTVVPYFDNPLDPFALLPDLTPDRIRLDPHASEATGLELSVRKPFTHSLTGWGTLSWARVADDSPQGDVLRSWDQPLSMTAGLAWKGPSASISALVAWHAGWPRTPLDLTPLQLQARNSRRWGDYISLDLRGSRTWTFASGDLTALVDLTNSTNQRNECCLVLEMDEGAPELSSEIDHWLPAIINIGFTYRWRSSR
ncbi:MAG TPA: TonB-dependent receptor [Steroidobacteraceae bacterium]|nr:TonB-dependent receptor [Steroidobacteraceae bacterium]